MASLLSTALDVLVPIPEVGRLASLRRATTLYSQGQHADALFIIDQGLVKLTRSNQHQGRIILAILGPGHVFGEEVLAEEKPQYFADAEVLTTATVVRVPRETLIPVLASNSELALGLAAKITDQKITLAEKIELLCLHDVEYRILHYLAELSSLIKPNEDSEGYQLPITQLELADLIGATRETTSTTLNQLERRGLVKLSRRLLTISSPETLRTAAHARASNNNGREISTAGSI